MALFTILILNRIIKGNRLKDFLLLGGWSAFLIVWKIDIGYANLIAVLAFILFLLAWHRQKALLVNALKAVIYVALPIIGVVSLIGFINDIDLILNTQKALSYFGADQAHGRPVLASSKNAIFYYHYYVFPVVTLLICIGIGFYVINGRQFTDQSRLLITAILYLATFYFANASRGLIRHNFIENNDVFISSFFFLIVGLTSFFVLNERRWQPYLSFFVVTTPVIHVFSYPDSKNHPPLYQQFNSTFKSGPKVELTSLSEQENRMKADQEFAKEHYEGFSTFMDSNFSDDATFIDLSNTPMLYFYTKRPVPSYFNQYIQNIVTEFLQKQNLQYLQNFNVPVTVFSHHPETWWDHTDGVPNTIRYHLITNYVYKHYEPYRLIDQYYIWLQKSKQRDNHLPDKTVDSSIEFESQQHNLEDYPFILGNYDELDNPDTLKSWPERNNSDSLRLQLDKAINPYLNYLEIHLDNKEKTKATIQYMEEGNHLGSYTFQIKNKEGRKPYRIPLSSQYNWIKREKDCLKLKWESDQSIDIKKVQLIRETKFDTLLKMSDVYP